MYFFFKKKVYTVTIGERLQCSCPDFEGRQKHCKHILMVLSKIFHLDVMSRAYRRIKLSSQVCLSIFVLVDTNVSIMNYKNQLYNIYLHFFTMVMGVGSIIVIRRNFCQLQTWFEFNGIIRLFSFIGMSIHKFNKLMVIFFSLYNWFFRLMIAYKQLLTMN